MSPANRRPDYLTAASCAEVSGVGRRTALDWRRILQ